MTPAEQTRVLGLGKGVEQIRAEWEAIEAKRPGGELPNVKFLLLAAGEMKRPEAEQAVLDVVRILHDTIRSYHVEMGTLLSENAALAAQNAQLRAQAGAVAGLGEVVGRYDAALEAVATVERNLTPEQQEYLPFVGGGRAHDDALEVARVAANDLLAAVRAALAQASAEGEGQEREEG